MENSNFNNFKYDIIDSSVAHHKEVMVAYSYQGKSIHQFFFIKEVRNKNDAYYINEAKKIVDQKIKNGELVKSSNKLVKKVNRLHSGGSAKPVFATLLALVVAVGAGVGGYFLHNYLKGENGGGGYIPQPGDELPADITVDNLPDGLSVTAGNKATIGDNYDTPIYLNENMPANADEYSLPDTLDKVSYKIGSQETEIKEYTYTLDDSSGGKQARLQIDKAYVLGQIDVKLTLILKQPIEFTVLNNSETRCHVYFDEEEIPLEGRYPVKLASGATSCKFKVTADDGFIVSSFDLGYKNDPLEKDKRLPSGSYSYNDEWLTINDTDTFKIKDICSLTIAAHYETEPEHYYASIGDMHGCTISYEGVVYDKPTAIKVYPEGGAIELYIKAKEGYAFTDDCYDLYESSMQAYVDSIVQEGDYLKMSIVNVHNNFYLSFFLVELPETCIYLDYESSKYGTFDGYTDIFKTIDSENEYFSEMFYPNDGYENTPFAQSVSNIGDMKIESQYYVMEDNYHGIYCRFDNCSIKEGQQFVIHLDEPISDPKLRLDDDSKDLIELTAPDGKVLGADEIPLKDYIGSPTAKFYFKGKDTSADYEYALSFGSFNYSYEIIKIHSDVYGDYYCANIIFSKDETYKWPGYDIDLHTDRYDVYEVSIKSFDKDKCSIYDKYRDPEHTTPLDSGKYNLVSVDGDITIAIRINTKQYMLHEDNIVIKGDDTFTSYEVVQDQDYWDIFNLIIHGVTGSFVIESIEPVSPAVTITSSLAEEYSGFTITTEDGELSTSEKDLVYNASADRLVFDVTGPDPDKIAVDALAYIDYETKDGKTGKLYGSFEYNFKLGANDFDRGELVFSSSDLYKYKSMVIHITTYEPDTTFAKFPTFEYQKAKRSPVTLVNVDGNSGTYFNATLFHKNINIYIVAEEELLPGNVRLFINERQVQVELQEVEYGEFNYMINVAVNSGDNLLLDC